MERTLALAESSAEGKMEKGQVSAEPIGKMHFGAL